MDLPAVTIPAYGNLGPNFIVWDKGYLSRQQIVLKKVGGAKSYPEGLILKLDGNEFVPFDGTGSAVCILYQERTFGDAETARATGVMQIAEVQRAMLKFWGEVSEPQKEAAYASLKANHIEMR